MYRMGLFDKSLLQLAESDLRALITDKETEGKTLDYKRDLVGQTAADRKEFLYDAIWTPGVSARSRKTFAGSRAASWPPSR